MSDDVEYEYVLRLVFAPTGHVSELDISESMIERHWGIVTRAQEGSGGGMYTEAKILRRPKVEWEIVREL